MKVVAREEIAGWFFVRLIKDGSTWIVDLDGEYVFRGGEASARTYFAGVIRGLTAYHEEKIA